MPFLERLLESLGFVRILQPVVPIDRQLLPRLELIAFEEQKPVDVVVQELLQHALAERDEGLVHLRLWEELTPREKQAAALACLGYTNSEIAQQMIISTNTVKTYMRQVLSKFEINSKAELRSILATWDFTPWIAGQDLGGE